MEKLTQRQVYDTIRYAYIRDYHGFYEDRYKGQNRLSRTATWYAVKNTVKLWKEQYE